MDWRHISHLPSTRLEAAPADAAGEDETAEHEEEDDNHDTEANDEELQGEELCPVPEVERQVVNIATECLLQLTSAEQTGGDWLKVGQ